MCAVVNKLSHIAAHNSEVDQCYCDMRVLTFVILRCIRTFAGKVFPSVHGIPVTFLASSQPLTAACRRRRHG